MRNLSTSNAQESNGVPNYLSRASTINAIMGALNSRDEHGDDGVRLSVFFDCPLLATVNDTSKVAAQMYSVFVDRVIPALQRAGWTIDSLVRHECQNIGDGITLGPAFVCFLKFSATDHHY
jgi:hypothetical protein